MPADKRVFVVGVGLTKFERPGSKRDYPELGKEAIQKALDDAKLSFSNLQAAIVGYCYGEPTCGQRVIYEMGLTGIPVCNVNNNCSTGSTALFLARNLIQAGHECVLAVGVEKMERNLSQVYTDKGWTSPVALHFNQMHECGMSTNPIQTMSHLNAMTLNVIKMFAGAAKEHNEKFGTNPLHYAKIAYKNHKHSVNNPFAQLQQEIPLNVIADTNKTLYSPLTLFEACGTADGSAAAILCSEEFVRKHNLENNAVEIVAQCMLTDLETSFDKEAKSFINLCGYDIAKKATEKCYNDANLSPKDVDVIEVHDCFASNELMVYEAIGLCSQGEGGNLVDSGQWVRNKQGGELFKLGNRWVVNPSGGLVSKGHPIGATGLAQCAELNWQLRNKAEKRQVEGAKVALQHNYGLGSAVVITLYKKYSTASRL